MKSITLLILLSLALISACSQESSSQSETMPGSDRDAHGCIASAGYSWCERTEQCEQPWELAEQEGFENTQPSFEAFCAQSGNNLR